MVGTTSGHRELMRNGANNKKLNFTRIGIIIALISVAFAGDWEVDRRGTTASSFLLMEVGANSMALGGTGTGFSTGAECLYWNPAMMTRNLDFRLLYEEIERPVGIRQNFVGGIIPLGRSNYIGVSLNNLNVGRMEITTVLDPQGTDQYFTAQDFSLGLSYARKLTDRVSVGVSGKYIREEIWLEKATGFAFDLSTAYQIPQNGFSLGMTIANIGPAMAMNDGPHIRYEQESDESFPGAPDIDASYVMKEFPLPVIFRFGLGQRLTGHEGLIGKQWNHIVTLFTGFNDGISTPFRGEIGLEYGYSKYLYLRVGRKMNYDLARLSAGFGIYLPLGGRKIIDIQYAWVDQAVFGSIQNWSIKVRL